VAYFFELKLKKRYTGKRGPTGNAQIFAFFFDG
jgi:hypothetical protein